LNDYREQINKNHTPIGTSFITHDFKFKVRHSWCLWCLLLIFGINQTTASNILRKCHHFLP